MTSRGNTRGKLAVAAVALVATWVTAMPTYAQKLVAPADLTEVETSVDLVLEAEPGTHWLIEIDGVKVALVLVDDSGNVNQTVWLGQSEEVRTLRVERSDGSTPFERRLVPTSWEPASEVELRPKPVATKTQMARSRSTLLVASIASPFAGWVVGYLGGVAYLGPERWRDGGPRGTGDARRLNNFLITTSVLGGVAIANLIASELVLHGDFLLPVGIPVVGIGVAAAMAFGMESLDDGDVDTAAVGITYAAALFSGIALFLTSPGSDGAAAIIQIGAAPTNGGGVVSLGGQF